jgi:phosphatidylglycerophosphatase A
MKFYSNFCRFFATDFYLGYIPYLITGKFKGGGTIGTAIGLIFVNLMHANSIHNSIFLILFIFFSIIVSDKATKDFNSKDDQRIIIDETAGYLISVYYMPINMFTSISAFFIFRFFDGIKPWPIRVIDKKIHGGLGIVLDDLIAGLFSNIVLRVILIFFKTQLI